MDGLNFYGPVKALKTHCVNGHLYTEETTKHTAKGSRQCRVCRQMARKRHNFSRRLLRAGISQRPHTNPPKTSIPLLVKLFNIQNEARLTDAVLEQASGYARNSLKGWRYGKHRPLLTAIVDIYDALGYDLVPVKRGKQ